MLVALFEATGERAYLDDAAKFTTSALTEAGLVTGDILLEKLGTKGDASLFKGVFARYLGQFRKVLAAEHSHSETVVLIDRVVLGSADAALKNGRDKDGAFLDAWHTGAKSPTHSFNAQISALAAIVAAIDSSK